MIDTEKPKLSSLEQENDGLARKWKNNPSQRAKIGGRLFEINRKIFENQKLFDEHSRQDFMQEAYCYMIQSLESYESNLGSFHYWLMYYVNHLGKYYNRVYKWDKSIYLKDDPPQYITPNNTDFFFWANIRRSINKYEWIIFRESIFNGLTRRQIAKKIGWHEKTVQKKFKKIIEKIRTEFSEDCKCLAQ